MNVARGVCGEMAAGDHHDLHWSMQVERPVQQFLLVGAEGEHGWPVMVGLYLLAQRRQGEQAGGGVVASQCICRCKLPCRHQPGMQLHYLLISGQPALLQLVECLRQVVQKRCVR